MLSLLLYPLWCGSFYPLLSRLPSESLPRLLSRLRAELRSPLLHPLLYPLLYRSL